MKQHTGKYRSKKLPKLLFITLLLVTLTGCGQSVETKQDHVEENPNIQIGFTMDSFLIERWQRDRDVFVSWVLMSMYRMPTAVWKNRYLKLITSLRKMWM